MFGSFIVPCARLQNLANQPADPTERSPTQLIKTGHSYAARRQSPDIVSSPLTFARAHSAL